MCKREFEIDKLQLIVIKDFSDIGHKKEDNELCDKCFILHKAEVDKCLEANKNNKWLI